MLGVVIVGAGQGGAALLRALEASSGQISIVGVADRDPAAPGLARAESLGIRTALDYRQLLDLPGVDIVVQATGDPAVEAEIQRRKPPGVRVVEGLAMQLLLSLVEEEERLLRQVQSKERERDAILGSAHDGILAVNRSGVITVCNAAAAHLLGLPREAMLGHRAAAVLPNTRLHHVLETGRSELNQQQRVGETTIITNRVPVRDESGEIVGAVAVFRDITEVRALAEEITALGETKVMLEAIIRSSQDAISVVGADGRVIVVNPAYTQLTGLSEEQVVGRLPTVDIDESQESMLLQVLRTGRPVRGVPMKVRPKNRDVIVDVAPIVVGGQVRGAVGILHDMSELARLYEELEQVNKLVRRLQARWSFDDIVADSAVMQQAVEQARRAAETPATVLLRGESGTGKELFAHAIHNASSRKNGQFLRVNCAALADTLLESELFGYVEGAFTGAKKGGRRGLFEAAAGGTIFLDEIGEISLGLQTKLLRVLQEKEIVRVGEARPIPVNVRIIAATNARLEEMIARGAFREDLYYRLNVVPIVIPPLRHRKEDIPRLATQVIERLNREYGRAVEQIDPEAMARLLAYHWPGNVRELENILGRALITMPFAEKVIRPSYLPDLPDGPAPGAAVAPDVAGRALPTLEQVVGAAERAALAEALRQSGGNKTAAARRLGIAPRTLYYKLERYSMLGEVAPAD